MLMRNFSKREKSIILAAVIALIIGFYFLVIHYPVKRNLEEIARNKVTTEDMIALATAKASIYRNMKEELDEIFAMPEDEITVMPEYDNIETIDMLLHSILPGDYAIQFGDVTMDGIVATRNISISFPASDYDNAKSILSQLVGTGYRCLMQNLIISPSEGDITGNNLNVSVNIVFYELVR